MGRCYGRPAFEKRCWGIEDLSATNEATQRHSRPDGLENSHAVEVAKTDEGHDVKAMRITLVRAAFCMFDLQPRYRYRYAAKGASLHAKARLSGKNVQAWRHASSPGRHAIDTSVPNMP